MKVLGISSAVSTMGAGIATEKDVVVEFSFSGKEAKSEKLISIIDEVLKKAEIDLSKIDGIAVVQGPGSYSGLRGGLAVAKSFAATLNVPIVGVSTLEAVAFNYINSIGTVFAAVHACKDEYNVALFVSNGGSLKRLSDDLVVKLDRLTDFLSEIQGDLMLASDEKVYKELVNRNKGSKIKFSDQKNSIPWAINVAKLGILKIKAGENEDYLSMTPKYSHKPNIREYNK